MAIQQLTDEQVRTMTVAQKDEWWFKNIYRGNMRQLTLRSAITGFILGGALSATNLYIGAKTGWTLGVGLTSVILAFAMFKVLSAIRLADDFTILENNAMQSIATAAGYMTGPLISGIAAYMMVTNEIMPWWQMLTFNVVLSILGVLVAFPLKRRFINDEQAPFPEGAACGVVLDTLYTSQAAVGLFKAKVLLAAGLFAGLLTFIAGESYQTYLQARILGLSTVRWLNESLDAWYYKLAEGANAVFTVPRIGGVDIRQLGLSPTLNLAMFGAGGLMHIRYATNMLLGMIAGWFILAPIAINSGWVQKKGVVLSAVDKFAFKDVLTGWVLWPGVAILVSASIASMLAKPQVIISSFSGLFKKGPREDKILKDIEVPLWISWVGIPIIGAIGVWMMHAWFGVRWDLGALAVLLTILLTLIAANATALTSITPTGSLSKITQFTFGVMNPKHAQTNLMTACMTTEVASNASNLLMDIKPGYMLGGKPRHQAIGHCIGIVAGGLASTPLFYFLFLNKYKAGDDIQQTLVTKTFSFTAAIQWKGVSEFINGVTAGDLSKIMHPSAIWAMAFAAVIGVVFEIVRVLGENKSPFSPLAFGLGLVLPPDSTFWMFLGAAFFWLMHKFFATKDQEGTFANRLWVGTHEPICTGLIAGAALIGIGEILVGAFLL